MGGDGGSGREKHSSGAAAGRGGVGPRVDLALRGPGSGGVASAGCPPPPPPVEMTRGCSGELLGLMVAPVKSSRGGLRGCQSRVRLGSCVAVSVPAPGSWGGGGGNTERGREMVRCCQCFPEPTRDLPWATATLWSFLSEALSPALQEKSVGPGWPQPVARRGASNLPSVPQTLPPCPAQGSQAARAAASRPSARLEV